MLSDEVIRDIYADAEVAEIEAFPVTGRNLYARLDDARTAGLRAVANAAAKNALEEAAKWFDRCHCTQADEWGNQMQAQDCPHHGDPTAQYIGAHVVEQLRNLAAPLSLSESAPSPDEPF